MKKGRLSDMMPAVIRLVIAIFLISSFQIIAKADDKVCFESRKGGSETNVETNHPNEKCSPETGAVLWWEDPFEKTIPMGEMPIKGDYSHAIAVVKPRTDHLVLYQICGVACHNGSFPPLNTNNTPRQLSMHGDIVSDALNLQHGRGKIWCLDCHNGAKRTKLLGGGGAEISFNQPQRLCGKCHGPAFRDWRAGIHGKRIGEWARTGKKRWFVCTECHNPHDVQQGVRNSGFAQIQSEPPPILPKSMKNNDHERPPK